MKPRPRSLAAGLSLVLAADAASLRAAQTTDPLAVPDTSPFDPLVILCNQKAAGGSGLDSEADTLFRATFGADEPPDKKTWCRDWLQCIKDKSMMTQDKDGVLQAWAPADCKEICGKFPAETPKEGQFVQMAKQLSTAGRLFSLSANSTKFDCVESCGNFQKSLSTCVATVLYEPGQVTVMGAPGQKPAAKEPPKYCAEKGTPCVAELQAEHQKCIVEKTKFVVKGTEVPGKLKKKCADLADDYDHCKDCPQMDEAFATQYYAFTGGCMQQLHAYHQATHPEAGVAAIPGATAEGCKVHR